MLNVNRIRYPLGYLDQSTCSEHTPILNLMYLCDGCHRWSDFELDLGVVEWDIDPTPAHPVWNTIDLDNVDFEEYFDMAGASYVMSFCVWDDVMDDWLGGYCRFDIRESPFIGRIVVR